MAWTERPFVSSPQRLKLVFLAGGPLQQTVAARKRLPQLARRKCMRMLRHFTHSSSSYLQKYMTTSEHFDTFFSDLIESMVVRGFKEMLQFCH
jgi:hypothetical protein